ncbi:MAG: pimeloyl-ACP methyl esterase BioG family protein, partial [Parabacteroides sp.]
MKIKKIQQGVGRKLYLILNGWSAAPELFEALPLPAGADVWVGYDYRSLAFPESLARFEELHLIAWSLGVWVATALWGDASPFTTTTAINGTPFPI